MWPDLIANGEKTEVSVELFLEIMADNKQLLDEVEHDIMNYQNQGLCYLPKPKAEADNTDTRF